MRQRARLTGGPDGLEDDWQLRAVGGLVRGDGDHVQPGQRALDTMNQRIDALQTEMNRRFDTVQAEMNRRFDAMQTEMNRRFDTMQAENQRQHDAMQEVLRAFEGRITRLEGKAGVDPNNTE